MRKCGSQVSCGIGWGNRFRRRILRFACIIIVVRARRVSREILFGGCGSGGRGRGHEARKVKELDGRVRLFFALASKNSAAGAVVSRCAHGESSRSRTARRRLYDSATDHNNNITRTRGVRSAARPCKDRGPRRAAGDPYRIRSMGARILCYCYF